MNALAFPKIFKNSSSVINTGKTATGECLRLLIASEKGELFGDPQFGVQLKRYTFNQNDYVLRDILIDEIYEQISLFCPQISVKRSDISIVQDKAKLYATIKAINNVDFTASMYNLILFEGDSE